MGWERVLMSAADGNMSAGHWSAMLRAEPRCKRGKPTGCAACPLRVGGEWEAGAKAALGDGLRPSLLRLFGCHTTELQCSGAVRLAAAAKVGE